MVAPEDQSAPHNEVVQGLVERFPDTLNQGIINWLSDRSSAHSDLVERLYEVTAHLDVVRWSPDGDFPFVVVATRSGLIVGVAEGMRELIVRQSAGVFGPDDGRPVLDIGPNWRAFRAFLADEPGGVTVEKLRRRFERAIEEAN